jgi:molecular chaperone DnaK (HSP70)
MKMLQAAKEKVAQINMIERFYLYGVTKKDNQVNDIINNVFLNDSFRALSITDSKHSTKKMHDVLA